MVEAMAQDEHGRRVLAEQEERIGHRMAEQAERGAIEATQGEPDRVLPSGDPDCTEPRQEPSGVSPRTHMAGDIVMENSDSGREDVPPVVVSTNPVGVDS